MPKDRERILKIIEQYKSKPLMERLCFKLERYLHYYLPFVEEQSKLDNQLNQLIKEAAESLEKDSPNAETKVEQAISTIKGKCIP